jgi:hypothetical protein
MKNIGYLLLCCSTLFSCNNPQSKSMNTPEWPGLNAPVAAVKPLQRILHGDTVTDNYYWMIDYFRKGPDSTAVLNYLREENEYTDTNQFLFSARDIITIPVPMKVSSISSTAAAREVWMRPKKYCSMLTKWPKDMLITV